MEDSTGSSQASIFLQILKCNVFLTVIITNFRVEKICVFNILILLLCVSVAVFSYVFSTKINDKFPREGIEKFFQVV